MKLHDFMIDPAICGDEFLAASWRPWRTVARLIDGDGALLDADDQALACQLTGSDVLPDDPPTEFYGVAGRRSGKSRFSAIALTHAAAEDYRDRLAPGEWASAICVATDRRQARTIFSYTEALIDGSDMLRAEVVHRTKETIEFAHRTRLEIHTASFRAVRGYTICLAVIDEAAFLRDERSATPDIELARALKPALATLTDGWWSSQVRIANSGCCGRSTSSTTGRWRDVNRGLVIQAERRVMNPLLDQEMIDAELTADREAAGSEWLGQFRSSTVQFLEDALIDRAKVTGRFELPFTGSHFAFIDPSGGRHDAMTLAIAHKEADRIVLDKICIERPPFEPEAIVERFCTVLSEYRLTIVTGDRYGGAWVSSAFSRHGVSYLPSTLDKSSIYTSVLPLFAQDRVELLDVSELLTELRLLERRPRAGGRGDLIDHPPKAHDDLANAVAGAFHLSSSEAAELAQTFPAAWIREAQARWQPEPQFYAPVCSLGVSRTQNQTIVAIRRDGWYAELITGAVTAAPEVAGFVVSKRRDNAIVVVDVETGNGVEVCGHLKTNGIEAKGFRGQVESRRRTEEKQLPFTNRQSEACWRFREALNPEQLGGSPIALPDDPEMVADLTAFTFNVTARGIEVKQNRPTPRAEAILLAWAYGPTAKAHLSEWRPDQRVGFMAPRKQHPKVDLGPRRSGFLRSRK